MNLSKWVIFGAGLGLMAATAGYLAEIRGTHRLGPAGVRIGPEPLYGEHGEKVAAESVLLPEKVLGAIGTNGAISGPELTGLPKDTTFGRRFYRAADGFQTMISVVVMGTDRSSIHDPHFCLVGGGWIIDKTEKVAVRVDRPYAYDLPVMKLTASTRVLDDQKRAMMVSGVYLYWFVTGDKITADQGVRLWSIAERMVEKRELERWAYIAYFAACPPGQEQATFERLERFIRASAPEIQVVNGKALGTLSPVAARR
jgi:hypothetical protein